MFDDDDVLCSTCNKNMNQVSIIDWIYDKNDVKKVYCCEHHEHQGRFINYIPTCIICRQMKGDTYKGFICVANGELPTRLFSSKKGKFFYFTNGGNRMYPKWIEPQENKVE